MKLKMRKNIYINYFLSLMTAFIAPFVSQQVCWALKNEIIPDNTLKTKILIDKDGNISGGLRSRNNQFYSFLKFSIGSKAYFIDPGVSNILVRVTGNQASIINGILGVSGGDANLFLLNPNGISFGTNASLSLNGSFMATTGDSILFDNGDEFSVAMLKTPSLLEVNLPIGVRFGALAKPIVNRSLANGFGLRVLPKKTLALLGGDISLVSGFIVSPDSRIELGSVAENSLVSISPIEFGWRLGYQDVAQFRDINISDFSAISTLEANPNSNTITNNGGDITLQGKRIRISNGSEISSTYSGNLLGGNININASELIELNNFSSVFAGTFDKKTLGDSGNINLKSRSIIIKDSIIETDSLGSGRSGKISLNASQNILLFDSQDILPFFRSSIFSSPGTIDIKTGVLLLRDALISGGSRNDKTGGNVTINSDLVVAEGSSQILANSQQGFGGQIKITAKGVFLSPDTVVSAASNLGVLYDGVVDFEITEPDPRRSLTKSPSTIIDPANLVSQNPCRRQTVSEFSNLGRGGLPTTIDQDQNPDTIQVGLVEPSSETSGIPIKPKTTQSLKTAPPPPETVEAAQGWQFNSRGEVVLLAYNPDAIGAQRLLTEPKSCETP